MRNTPLLIGGAIGLILNLTLATFIIPRSAEARPATPCTYEAPLLLDHSPCLRSPGECLDGFAQGTRLVWESIFPPSSQFMFPDSIVHDPDSEILAPTQYVMATTSSNSWILHVYDLDQPLPDDPEVAAFICPDQMNILLQYDVRCRIVLGEAETVTGSSGVLGMAFSFENGAAETIHKFIILAPLAEDVVSELRVFAAARKKWMGGEGGCFPFTEPCDRLVPPEDPCIDADSCDREWRRHTAQALREFTGCMKKQVAPLGLLTTLCIVACFATGPLIPPCVAACLGAASIGGMIDFSACQMKLDFEKDQALIKYCACLQWKIDNCLPIDHEPPVHNCP